MSSIRDYTGIPYATLPRPEASDFTPRLREMLYRIDYYLRDSNRGIARITQGQVPDGSGKAIGSTGSLTDYFYLPGRNGGQVAHGDTFSGGKLTLVSTAHGTKGKIFLGASEGSAFDEDLIRLGIGIASPTATIHAREALTAAGAVMRPNSTVAAGAWLGQDGGSSLHTYIDEIVPDTTDYIKVLIDGSPPGAILAQVGMAAPASVPSASLPHVFRYRYRRTGTSSPAPLTDLHVQLFNTGSTPTQSVIFISHDDLAAAGWIENSVTLSASEITALRASGAGAYQSIELRLNYAGSTTPNSAGSEFQIGFAEIVIGSGTGAVVMKAEASNSGQELDLFQAINTTATAVRVLANGRLVVDPGGNIGAETPLGSLDVRPATAADRAIFVRGLTSQTGNLFEARNAADDSLFALDSAGRVNWREAAEPSAPSADRLLIWPEDRGGKTILNTVASDGIFQQLMRDNVAVMIADETVAKGDAVYMSATGATGVFGAVRKALASDAAKMPVVGVALEAITAGNKGRIMFSGLARLDTTGYAGAPADGATVYVDASTAGRLTTVAPTHPNIRQAVGVIATHGVGNGRVEISPAAQIGTGFGTNENIWRIGDNTAGTKTLRYRNGFDLDLNAAPTAGRVITLPDATGTAALLERVQTFTRKQTITPSVNEQPLEFTLGSFVGDRLATWGSTPGSVEGALGYVTVPSLSALFSTVEVMGVTVWGEVGIDGGSKGILHTDGPLTADREWKLPNGSGTLLMRIGAIPVAPRTTNFSGTLATSVTGHIFVACYAECTVGGGTGSVTIKIQFTNRNGAQDDTLITLSLAALAHTDKFASIRLHGTGNIDVTATKSGTGGTYAFNIVATRP